MPDNFPTPRIMLPTDGLRAAVASGGTRAARHPFFGLPRSPPRLIAVGRWGPAAKQPRRPLLWFQWLTTSPQPAPRCARTPGCACWSQPGRS